MSNIESLDLPAAKIHSAVHDEDALQADAFLLQEKFLRMLMILDYKNTSECAHSVFYELCDGLFHELKGKEKFKFLFFQKYFWQRFAQKVSQIYAQNRTNFLLKKTHKSLLIATNPRDVLKQLNMSEEKIFNSFTKDLNDDFANLLEVWRNAYIQKQITQRINAILPRLIFWFAAVSAVGVALAFIYMRSQLNMLDALKGWIVFLTSVFP